MTLREYIFENLLKSDEDVISVFVNSQVCAEDCPIKEQCDFESRSSTCWKVAEKMLDKEIDE